MRSSGWIAFWFLVAVGLCGFAALVSSLAFGGNPEVQPYRDVPIRPPVDYKDVGPLATIAQIPQLDLDARHTIYTIPVLSVEAFRYGGNYGRLGIRKGDWGIDVRLAAPDGQWNGEYHGFTAEIGLAEAYAAHWQIASVMPESERKVFDAWRSETARTGVKKECPDILNERRGFDQPGCVSRAGYTWFAKKTEPMIVRLHWDGAGKVAPKQMETLLLHGAIASWSYRPNPNFKETNP